MIRLTTADKLENAINKARTFKPRVRINCFGSYDVQNKQTGAIYNVVCMKRDGRRFALAPAKQANAGRLAITLRRQFQRIFI